MQCFVVDESARDEWNSFVSAHATGSFLQSWEWGDFQRAAGFPVKRFVVRNNGDVAATALFISRPLSLGLRYVYAPYGPVIQDGCVPKDVYTCLRDAVVSSRRATPVFIRIEPKAPLHSTERSLRASGFKVKEFGIQPKETVMLDLRKHEDEILAGCKQKTRYNIRLAVRRGVTVREDTSKEGLNIFLRLAKEVEGQGIFHYHPPSYYEHMLKTLGSRMLSIFIAEHEGEALAAGLFMKYGNTMTYAHGASTRVKNEMMAPYALHWHAVKMAKERGCAAYDFFGVAPAELSHHPWAGISRFKRGFGGAEYSFSGVADMILERAWYELFAIGRALRGIIQ